MRSWHRPEGAVHLTTQTIDVANEAAVKGFFEGIGAFNHLVFTAGDDATDWLIGRQGSG